MIAIILAGGKSSRLGQEKALISIGGSENQKRLIELAVESARESKAEEFVIAISKNTPKTADYCKRVNYNIVETPGEGYHADLGYLLALYPEFVSITSDIPFLKSEHINAIIDAYLSHKPRISITGAVPRDIVPKTKGLILSYTFRYKGKEFVSCGINVVTSSKNSIPCIINDPLLAINVNTSEDLRVARRMLE